MLRYKPTKINLTSSPKNEPISFSSFKDMSKYDNYKRKYKKMKKMVEELIFENAALCDQIAILQEKTLLLIEERNFLWKKLQQYQPYGDNDSHYRSQGMSHGNDSSVIKKGSTKRRNDRIASDSSEVNRTPKSSKKSSSLCKKKKLVNSIPLDANGKPIFPIVLGDFTVHSLGEVCDKIEYHTDELIYPVGYCSTRIYGSLKDPEKQCVYTCKVMDGGQAPRFEIVADTDLDVPLVSGSIDECHSMLLQLINSCLGAEVVNTKGRGADFFGLSHPTVHHLIQASPGVRKCKGYVWTKFEQVSQSSQSSPDELEASLSYSALLRSISFSKSHLENVREKEEETLRGILLS